MKNLFKTLLAALTLGFQCRGEDSISSYRLIEMVNGSDTMVLLRSFRLDSMYPEIGYRYQLDVEEVIYRSRFYAVDVLANFDIDHIGPKQILSKADAVLKDSKVLLAFNFKGLPEVLDFAPREFLILEKDGIVYVPSFYFRNDVKGLLVYRSSLVEGYYEIDYKVFSKTMIDLRDALLKRSETGHYVRPLLSDPFSIYCFDLLESRLEYSIAEYNVEEMFLIEDGKAK